MTRSDFPQNGHPWRGVLGRFLGYATRGPQLKEYLIVQKGFRPLFHNSNETHCLKIARATEDNFLHSWGIGLCFLGEIGLHLDEVWFLLMDQWPFLSPDLCCPPMAHKATGVGRTGVASMSSWLVSTYSPGCSTQVQSIGMSVELPWSVMYLESKSCQASCTPLLQFPQFCDL